MFRAVYDEGLVTQSHAILRGEERMKTLSGAANAWMYLLLGDPDLQIRRRNPLRFVLEGVDRINVCLAPSCRLTLRVEDELGNPVPEALVGFWKAGLQGEDEVFVNRYADEDGQVTLEASVTSEGTLYYSVEDGAGNAIFGSMEVESPAARYDLVVDRSARLPRPYPRQNGPRGGTR